MSRRHTYGWAISALLLAAPAFPAIGRAAQFPALDPSFAQEIYTGPLVGAAGMAWTSSNHLLTRNGADILEYSPTQNTTYQGTSLHGTIATHTITGLLSTGYGMTNGLDGYIYTVTGSGLQRFNPSNWAAPAQTLAGTVGGAGYGIATLPDGRIVYSDGAGSSSVYIYDPVATTNTYLYTSSALVDGMTTSPGGNIAITGQTNSTMTILTNTGSVVNSFATPHYPDGLAFSPGITSSTLYSNNNDGTITRYVLGPGFTGTPVVTDIASGSGAYGDLAAVGPDCAFYVSQFDNGGYHGSTAGVGTHWDNAVTTNEPSIIRISMASLNGLPDGSDCAFYTPLEGANAPEPASVGMLGIGALTLLRRARRCRQ